MELILLSLLLLMMSLVHSGLLEVVPSLTVQPNYIFIGETVTLTCKLPAETGTEWMYMWYRNEQKMHSSTENYYVIKEIKEHQDQIYKCYSRETRGQRQTSWSNEVTLTVRARPKPVLRVSPQNPVFTGESLTLSCELQSTGWQFHWSKDSEESEISTAAGTKSIQSVQLSDGGHYMCRSQRGNPPYHTYNSDAIMVTVRGTPTPELTSSLKGAALLGSSVTLHCKLEQPAGWSFYWSRHTQNPENETNTATSSYTISSVAPSDGGQYWCRAGRRNPVYYTHYSDALWVNVTVTEAQFSILRPLSSLLAVTPYLLATIVLGVKCFRARAQTGKNQSQFAVIEE